MMRSLFSGISGLRNHQTRMDVIGNNVSNVNTTGFKASRTIFQDIFSQTLSGGMANTGATGGTNPTQVGLGIRLSTIDVMHTGAPFGRTDNPFDMMIENEGFFIVEGPEGNLFTRVGNFGLDNEGFLVTSEGMFVLGFGPTPEQITFRPAELEQPGFQGQLLAGFVTNPANVRLLADPLEPTHWVGGNMPNVGTPAPGFAFAGSPQVTPGDPAFDANIQVANPNNPAHWVPGDVPVTGTPAAGFVRTQAEVRELAYTTGSGVLPVGHGWANNQPTIAPVAARPAAADFPPQDQWDMENLQRIRLRVPDPNNPDEFADLLGFNVAANGTISVVIDNISVPIAQVGLALFANNNGLERAGNSLWRQSASSGEAVITRPMEYGAGTINGGGLEMSNVDLASEFTDMIVTQRGYQANSRIITVSDSLLEELVNLKR